MTAKELAEFILDYPEYTIVISSDWREDQLGFDYIEVRHMVREIVIS